VSIVVCSLALTLLVFNLRPIIVGEKIEYGIKYSLPDGLELYRSDFGDPPYYALAKEGDELDAIDVIVSLFLDENLNPESTSILGIEPQLNVTLDWESRRIVRIGRHMPDGGVTIDKDGDGMPDIRNIREFPDGPLRGREIFFEGRWVLVKIKEEKFNVTLPDGEFVPVEFHDGQWSRIED